MWAVVMISYTHTLQLLSPLSPRDPLGRDHCLQEISFFNSKMGAITPPSRVVLGIRGDAHKPLPFQGVRQAPIQRGDFSGLAEPKTPPHVTPICDAGRERELFILCLGWKESWDPHIGTAPITLDMGPPETLAGAGPESPGIEEGTPRSLV